MDTLSIEASPVMQKNLLETAREIGPFINEHIGDEENDRRLSRPVLDALKKAGFFRLYLPKSLGGLEADPLTIAKLIEEVACHNTAAGWSLMVANTTSWWGGRLPERGIAEIYKGGPDTVIAAAFHPPMKATPVDGGYIVNGRSPLMSNVHEALWIFVTAFVMEGENIKMTNGRPEIIGVFMD